MTKRIERTPGRTPPARSPAGDADRFTSMVGVSSPPAAS
jgi:hypothetical protein